VQSERVFVDGSYYVQEVLDAELGGTWKMSELQPAPGSVVWLFSMQP
jgi:hypothetical protein